MRFLLTVWVCSIAGVLSLGPARADDEPLRLSELLRALSDDPQTRDAALGQLGRRAGAGGLLGPAERRALLEAVERKDWAAIDRFPSMSVKGMGVAIKLAGVGQTFDPPPPETGEPVLETLKISAPQGAPSPESLWTPLGAGLEAGDALDPARARRYANSVRLAQVLNRLAENDPRGDPRYAIFDEREITSVEGLLQLLLRGRHRLEVQDARALANFGDLRYRGREVVTPFWLDTGVAVPGRAGSLVVPVTHSEHRFLIRGPVVNADLCFFFGIDGDAAFRPLVTLDQGWTGGVVKHSYRGERALPAARLAGAIRRSYLAKRRAHAELAFGGYFPFGVCNDVNAMLELHMTGATSLYPLTRDLRFFKGDDEVSALARRLPVDTGPTPNLERVLSSLPVARLRELPFPELRADLEALRRGRPELGALKIFGASR